ncbi:hypothetical protein AVANI_13 [Mycobacterium phage Avani]|uniref:Tail terminator n=6 Tax=Avanivirus TaxID=2843352 RepID=A0A2D1G9Q5_9CAUD|nr:hypothetical protein PBI_CHE9D_13 [Mycobacterium phage Che9d]YP_008410685.1 hypothetical protein N850_gp014 [Mycobacterium phage Jabbawokkie]YP_009013108.1 hypothetical protein CL78_gp013 [Mycobacterium phage Avani]YP_009613917.1 hypothetical protein FDI59_gp013 [Mycobacterium phage Yoshi]YP_009963711.1 hypothetical protein I5I02_gp013 [Mycobacterium phage Demsculpinboyz]YP_009963828.1 hypothetical protein I5I03_gp013 [Mycobacterium phage Soul22]YP_009963931.1 hypothetical protein I5I04_gp
MGDFWLPDAPGVLTGIRIVKEGQPGIRVSDEMPTNRPNRIIIISQVDGRRPNPVQSVHRLLVECWLSKALRSSINIEAWCGEVSSVLRNSAGSLFSGVFSYGWSNQQGPVDFPDPDVTDMDRWQFHGDLTLSTK